MDQEIIMISKPREVAMGFVAAVPGTEPGPIRYKEHNVPLPNNCPYHMCQSVIKNV